ncbi:MAG: TonB-dependent receptor [Tannerella sp.]|nr:TonB-dependent receptor [Tannerella sp.]
MGISIINARGSYSQETLLSLNLNNKTVREVFDEIERNSEFVFFYYTNAVDENRKVRIQMKNRTIDKILDRLFEDTDNVYTIDGRQIYIARCVEAESPEPEQSKTKITGTVVDQAGEPVIGANIMEKGTTNGTVTDLGGRFTLDVLPGAALAVSFIGFVSQEIAVGSRTDLNITLAEDNQALEEIVVVGYGVQKKVNLSGAVQQVSSKELSSRPITNANQALQGLAANVNISQVTGRATSAPDINIRGFTSINGGSALILVDNVPVSADELSRINPEDIESMSILKDAASAAIYGGRAAFGVVLVTTKQARSEKLEVSVDVNAGVRRLGVVPDLVTDPYEVVMLQNPTSTRNPLFSAEEVEYARNRSLYPDLYPAAYVNKRGGGLYDVGSWAYFDNINWYDQLLRKYTPTYTGNVRVSNKSDKMSYTVSGGYFKQDGVMRFGNDLYDRFNLRGNGSYNLTSWWQAGANMSLNYSKYDVSDFGNDWYFFHIDRQVLRSFFNPDGTPSPAWGYLIGLPRDGGRNITKTNETQVSLNTTIDLIKDVWNIKADANFRFTNSSAKGSHFPSTSIPGPDKPAGTPYADLNNALTQSVYAQTEAAFTARQIYNVYTDYHNTFAGKHYVQGILGFNQESMRYTYSLIRRNDLISQSLPTIQLATGMTTSQETIQTLALRGAFGRLNYIYDNKYIAEFNGRYDGTSRFPKNSRFGFFPSGSLAWVISKENFLAPVAESLHVDQLKFRGSYGVLGNQIVKTTDGKNLDVYWPYIATMSANNINVPVNNAMPLAVFQPGVVASNLTWERVRTVNFGGDLALFNNRISLGVDVYTRYTEGMLVPGKALPNVFGHDVPKENAGDLKTKGWEVTLGLNNTWQVDESPLHLSLNFMLADARSYVTRFDNPTRGISDAPGGNANYYAGQEIGEIWGWVTDGYLTLDDLILREDGTPTGNAKIDQYDVSEEDNRGTGVSYEGDIKFRDLDGDGRITYGKSTVDDPGDRRIIGNDQIRLPYSFELNASWKGFDLRAFFQGVGKRDWYAGHNHRTFWGVYGNPWNTPIKENLDHWTPENQNARWPRLKPYIAENKELALPQTGYLQDASYLRLKNVTLGYTLPRLWTKALHLSYLRIYFSAENVFAFDRLWVKGIDPELLTNTQVGYSGSGVYPLQSVYSLGLNLNF